MVVWLACVAPRNPRPNDALVEAVVPRSPTIQAVELACDLDDGVWTLEVETGGWAEEVWSWWSADGVYVEDRAVPSAAYAPDGTAEEFTLVLPIATDFRDIDERINTALPCGADPSVRIVSADIDGNLADCADIAGALMSWDLVAGTPPCPL